MTLPSLLQRQNVHDIGYIHFSWTISWSQSSSFNDLILIIKKPSVASWKHQKISIVQIKPNREKWQLFSDVRLEAGNLSQIQRALQDDVTYQAFI